MIFKCMSFTFGNSLFCYFMQTFHAEIYYLCLRSSGRKTKPKLSKLGLFYKILSPEGLYCCSILFLFCFFIAALFCCFYNLFVMMYCVFNLMPSSTFSFKHHQINLWRSSSICQATQSKATSPILSPSLSLKFQFWWSKKSVCMSKRLFLNAFIYWWMH